MTGINVPVGNVVDRVGDARVDGLIGLNWGSNNLSYSDPNSPSDYGAFYPVPILSVTQISSGQLLAVQWALDANGPIASNVNAGVFSVEAFTNANFDYRGGGTGAAVLRFANSEDPGTAYSFMPQQGDVRSGDVFFGGSGRLPVHGTADYLTILQQAAHGLGLKYAHDASQWGPVSAAWDALEYTVMSFRSYVGAEIGEYSNEIGGMPQTYMMGDIRALQQQYGADAGALIFHWARRNSDNFTIATLAVKALYQDKGARKAMAKYVAKNVNTEDASETDRALLSLVSGGAAVPATVG